MAIGELGKEAFGGVEQGRRGGREVEGPAWMLGEPLANLWMLVSGIVVDDCMDRLKQIIRKCPLAIAPRQFTCRSFLHLQGGAIEGRHHGLHQPVLGNVGVRTFVWFGEEGSRRNPVRRKRTSNQRALNHLEIDSV